jgi:hypothetical protein
MKAHTRSALTLVVLAVVFVIGVAWAWNAVTQPFPEPEDAPPCDKTRVAAGDKVVPEDVLVSVLNASKRNGLAGETMDDLLGKGFGEGTRDNVAAHTGRGGAVVWTDDPENPAAELVRSYLGKKARIVEQTSSEPGIVVVVGDAFPGVVKGRKSVTAQEDTYVCVPPEPIP